MAYGDWRDLTHQNAFAPTPSKFDSYTNLYNGMRPYMNRPYTQEMAYRMRESDNIAFIMDWLSDGVLQYFDTYFPTPQLVYQSIAQLEDRLIYTGSVNDIPALESGDVIFLSDGGGYNDDSVGDYYVLIYMTPEWTMSFDDNTGFRSDSLNDILSDYESLDTVDIMRI